MLQLADYMIKLSGFSVDRVECYSLLIICLIGCQVLV